LTRSIELAGEMNDHRPHYGVAKIAEALDADTRGIDVIVDRGSLNMRVKHVTSND